MKNKQENFTFIDLFAGIGGFRVALESFGGKCVFSSDWDKHAQIVYKTNFKEKPIGDITKIEARDIPFHNVICAGFPCQAFSVSGKQKGFEDTRGTLFFDIVRIAEYHKPEILFLENVKNLTKHNKGETLKIILRTLNEIGYDVFYEVLNASYYGVPQSRKRVYFVGLRKDLRIKDFEFPKPGFKPVMLKNYLQPKLKTGKFIIQREDVRIYDNPKLTKDIFGNYPLSPIQVGIINKGGQGERIYDTRGHAITLSAYGGGAASKTGAYFSNGVIRRLTPYECSQIMGFPKNFKIPVADSAAYKLFGNSVVVPVLKKIFKEIIKKTKLWQ